jgi:hypothetical protein
VRWPHPLGEFSQEVPRIRSTSSSIPEEIAGRLFKVMIFGISAQERLLRAGRQLVGILYISSYECISNPFRRGGSSLESRHTFSDWGPLSMKNLGEVKRKNGRTVK